MMTTKLFKFTKYSAALLITITTILGLIFLALDRETQSLSPESRMLLPASSNQNNSNFVELSSGHVHYELSGENKSRVVVLVHGFSIPAYVWEPTFLHLINEGYTVLRYDLYGRGFSDRPEVDYTMDVYVKQLDELLEALDISEPINLIGLSMGGAIATHYTNAYPEKVAKVGLIAPLVETPMRPEIKPMLMPNVGEYLSTVILIPKLSKGVSKAVYDISSFPNWETLFTPQTNFKGFRRAILSSIRNLAGKSFEDQYLSLGKLNKPVLLIWGQEDQTLPFSDSARVLAAIPNAHFTALKQTGHLPNYEKPDQVNALLSTFLKRH